MRHPVHGRTDRWPLLRVDLDLVRVKVVLLPDCHKEAAPLVVQADSRCRLVIDGFPGRDHAEFGGYGYDWRHLAPSFIVLGGLCCSQ